MSCYRKTFVAVLLIFMISTTYAEGNLGQAGANFLQIPVDPRGAALGGALTASAVGAEALYWNPAGAVSTENIDVIFALTDWFLDTKLAYGGVVKNFGNIGSFGLSVTSFYMDALEITSVYQPDGTNQFYDAGDISLGLSYARSLTESFSFGLTVKYVHEHIWNETASQIAFDLGSIYYTQFLNLKIGMAIRNVSGTLSFEGQDIEDKIAAEQALNINNNPRVERLTPEFRLPQVFQMGIAFEPFQMENSALTLVTDAEVPSDNTTRLILGAEYNYGDFIFLRGSYRMNYDLGDFALGLGLKGGISGFLATVNYAFNTQGYLGDVHRFSFGLAF